MPDDGRAVVHASGERSEPAVLADLPALAVVDDHHDVGNRDLAADQRRGRPLLEVLVALHEAAQPGRRRALREHEARRVRRVALDAGGHAGDGTARRYSDR